VLASPAYQRPMPPLRRFLLSLPHPATSHRAPLQPSLVCQPLTSSQPRPAALPCRATVPPPAPDGRGPLSAAPCYRLLRWAPLLSFSCPHAAPSRPPSFPSSPRAPSALKSRQPPTSLPFFSIFLLHPLRAPLPPLMSSFTQWA
jgi:hypothetical protein